MSRLSSYLRSLKIRKPSRLHDFDKNPALASSREEIVITGHPPHRMATFSADEIIGSSIRQTGKFQEDAILKVLDFVGKDSARGTVFLDIGANIGTHSIFALNNGFSRAVCVEPEPNNFMLLRINQILNGVEDRCINIRAAVSDTDSVVKMELSGTNYGDHRILALDTAKGNAFNESSRQTINIQTTTFNGLLERIKVDPRELGLIWIDTQGHEGHVLSCADVIEKTNTPIVLEFWPYGLQRSGGYPMLRQLFQRSSRIYDLSTSLNGQKPLSLDQLDQLYQANSLGKKAAFWHADLLIL